jgi:hypothetical protein
MLRQRSFTPLLGAVTLLAAAGCSSGGSSDGVQPPGADVVFADNYGPSVSFQGFGDGAINDVSIDSVERHGGATSLRISVPATFFTGGAFTSAVARDLSGYDALTFWAKASKAVTLNVAGIGVDNTPVTPFKADRTAIPLTTTWTKVVIPLPLPAKLTAEKGLFYFAEGSDEGAYTVWLDDVRFEKLPAGTLGAPQPAIANDTITTAIGTTALVQGTAVTFPVDGSDVTLAASPRYFTFASTDDTVAWADPDGVVTTVGLGTAEITATLGEVAAAGTLTVEVVPPIPPEPDAAAPTPAVAAADVISLFSDAYTDVAVDAWSTDWDDALVDEVTIAGDPTKKYTDPGGVEWGLFIGIEFVGANVVDASTSGMTHFHFDVWSQTATTLSVKLVDLGDDGTFDAPNPEHELVLSGVTPGTWLSYDIPFTDFTNLTTRAHLAQLIFVASNGASLFLDNVYFHK